MWWWPHVTRSTRPVLCGCSQAVKSVDAERARLEAEAEALADQQGDEVEARLEDIYER